MQKVIDDQDHKDTGILVRAEGGGDEDLTTS